MNLNRRKALPDPSPHAIDCGGCHYSEPYHGRLWCCLHKQSAAFARDDELTCGREARSFLKRNVA